MSAYTRRMEREHDARGACTALHMHSPCAECGREDYNPGTLGHDGLCNRCAEDARSNIG